MSSSYTYSTSFTLTHAKHIASKVATDLSRFSRFYNAPSIEMIDRYEIELVALLNDDYLDSVTYGFKRDGKWVEALRYHALPGGSLVGDDDPGKIRPGIDLAGATFGSYLLHNNRWNELTSAQQAAFQKTLPFNRGGSAEPTLESGYWAHNLNYSAGGRGVGRSSIIR